jgi:hypothetical protein
MKPHSPPKAASSRCDPLPPPAGEVSFESARMTEGASAQDAIGSQMRLARTAIRRGVIRVRENDGGGLLSRSWRGRCLRVFEQTEGASAQHAIGSQMRLARTAIREVSFESARMTEGASSPAPGGGGVCESSSRRRGLPPPLLAGEVSFESARMTEGASAQLAIGSPMRLARTAIREVSPSLRR